MDSKEKLVLINFLKTGLSTRALDNLMGCDKTKTRGWKSFEILRRYNLKDSDKGVLFLYSNSQCISFIKKLNKIQLSELIRGEIPKIINKYSNSKVLAKDEYSFYQVMGGETRNIIQSFFTPMKKIVKPCQFLKCYNKDLDTVHLNKERPTIFMDSAKELRLKKGNLFEYPILETMEKFLKSHQRRGVICFLCKEHHLELHKLVKSGGKSIKDFKKKIELI